jgi:hypothetical protein
MALAASGSRLVGEATQFHLADSAVGLGERNRGRKEKTPRLLQTSNAPEVSRNGHPRNPFYWLTPINLGAPPSRFEGVNLA